MQLIKKLIRGVESIQHYFRFVRMKKLCRNLSQRRIVEFDSNWFKGKRIAIIGGADSVLKEKLGTYIDSFDVVVRINKGVDVIDSQSEYVGTRTDVLFHAFYERENDRGSSPITVNSWVDKGVKLIIFSRNFEQNLYAAGNFADFLMKNKNALSFSQLPLDFCEEELKSLRPVSPTTGFTAINTVLKCQPREVYLTGITFFKTPHNELYREFNDSDFNKVFKVIQNHNADLEYAHIKRLYLESPDIIKPDKTLERIFYSN